MTKIIAMLFAATFLAACGSTDTRVIDNQGDGNSPGRDAADAADAAGDADSHR